MHVFNIGFGKDLAASSLVWLAERRVFNGRSIHARLSEAFDQFMLWCEHHGKMPSIKSFDMQKTLKMKSNLAQGFIPALLVSVLCQTLR